MLGNEGKSAVSLKEMGCLRRVHDVTLRDKVHICEIRKDLRMEPPLWVESVRPCYKIVPGKIGQASSARYIQKKAAKKSTKEQCCDYICDLAWSCLGVEPAELSKIVVGLLCS